MQTVFCVLRDERGEMTGERSPYQTGSETSMDGQSAVAMTNAPVRLVEPASAVAVAVRISRLISAVCRAAKGVENAGQQRRAGGSVRGTVHLQVTRSCVLVCLGARGFIMVQPVYQCPLRRRPLLER